MPELDRRTFAALLPALLAALSPEAQAQQTSTPASTAKPPLPTLTSGVYPPGPTTGSGGRKAHRFLAGMLTAGNIQIEMHETEQQPGTPHEAIGTHLHNEIWLVREGTCDLMTNGVTRRMNAGDVGLCCAGDTHWVSNAGDTVCKYFVVTVGPPEPR
jgi:mannose-6-phosphate isomerase-like protein (cupin superfamily)